VAIAKRERIWIAMRRCHRARVRGKPAKLACAELQYGASQGAAPSAAKLRHGAPDLAPEMPWQQPARRVGE
jgi:hypothetical protein